VDYLKNISIGSAVLAETLKQDHLHGGSSEGIAPFAMAGTDVVPFLFLTGSHHLMGNQVAGIVESIDIRCLVEKVFAVATDAARCSTWHTAIAEAEQASAGPVESRHDLQGTIRLMGRSMPWTATATQYDAIRKSGKRSIRFWRFHRTAQHLHSYNRWDEWNDGL